MEVIFVVDKMWEVKLRWLGYVNRRSVDAPARRYEEKRR